MPFLPDAFTEGAGADFEESPGAERVCGIATYIEKVTLTYVKTLPGFVALSADVGGTVTDAVEIALNKLRRYYERTVDVSYRVQGSDTLEQAPDGEGICQLLDPPTVYTWDNTATAQTVDSQAVGSNVPSTTGGFSASITQALSENVCDWAVMSRTAVLAANGTTLMDDRIGHEDIIGGTFTVESLTQISGSIGSLPGSLLTVAETRSSEVSYSTWVSTMMSRLGEAGETTDLAGMWVSGVANKNIRYSEARSWVTPWIETFSAGHKAQTVPVAAASPGFDMTATGAEIEETGGLIAGTTTLYNPPTMIAGPEMGHFSSHYRGQRVQWRSTMPLTYGYVEILSNDGSDGKKLYRILLESAEVDAEEIREMPVNTIPGWGTKGYGTGQKALLTKSAVWLIIGSAATAWMERLNAATAGAPYMLVETW